MEKGYLGISVRINLPNRYEGFTHCVSHQVGKCCHGSLFTNNTGQALTAVEWAPKQIGGQYVLAFGDESGKVVLWGSEEPHQGQWKVLHEIAPGLSHISTVRRIR